MGSEILWLQVQVCMKLTYLSQMHTQAQVDLGVEEGDQDSTEH